MCSDLHDSIGGPRRRDHGTAFQNGMTYGFFDKYMRPLLHRLDHAQSVPMVGRRDNTDRRPLPRQHFTKIIVFSRLIARTLLNLIRGGGKGGLVDIANAHHLTPAGCHRLAGDVHPPPTRTNEGSTEARGLTLGMYCWSTPQA